MAIGAYLRTDLRTPPLPCLVPESVFDAFGWCTSDSLEWRRPSSGSWNSNPSIDGSNPPGMVFVFHKECDFLPRELGCLHAFGLGLIDEWALAPYAIDDATDELYERRIRPRDLMWLAANHINSLLWGLHDWAHFHNHGPFEQRAWTELQCDSSALVWTWMNRGVIGFSDESWEVARAQFEALNESRFREEGIIPNLECLESERLRELATKLERRPPIG